MTSIVIPAHNEATVIGLCLDSLLADAQQDEFDVTVVANGCEDSTATVAGRWTGVRVLEIEAASKPAALNAGDAVAKGYPRIYLDADVVVTTAGARALRDAVAGPDAGSGSGRAEPILVAVPGRHLDLSGRPVAVRAYFAINSRLPAFTAGLFGRGMIALSEPARARFDRFPDMVADDLFLDSLFAPTEKRTITRFSTTVAAPYRTKDLVRRLARVRRGNAAMRAAARAGDVQIQVRPTDRWAWFTQVVVPQPRFAPAAVVYVGLTALAALLARRRPNKADPWGRDSSTRADSRGPQASMAAKEPADG